MDQAQTVWDGCGHRRLTEWLAMFLTVGDRERAAAMQGDDEGEDVRSFFGAALGAFELPA